MGRTGAAATLVALVLIASCTQQPGTAAPDSNSTSTSTTTTSTSIAATTTTEAPEAMPAEAMRLAALKDAAGPDTFEVWICDVPVDTTDPTYGDPTLRLPLSPDDVIRRAGSRVRGYFTAISFGVYQPRFIPGGTISMAPGDTSQTCVDNALDQSSPTATAVFAIATAEHTAQAPGGWGTPGTWASCTTSCEASITRRSAYVGASDFHPDWGFIPALDLIEHEIGHTIGLPHSGEVLNDKFGYTSALDVMSNSAAPRDVDPWRRHGPDTLAVNRLAVGWLPLDDVAHALSNAAAASEPQPFTLAPSTASSGTRLLLLPIDEHRMLTVEYLRPTGFDNALPEAGVAVHLIDDSAGEGVERLQETLVGTAPYTDLLGLDETFVANGWSLRVISNSASAVQVAVTSADR